VRAQPARGWREDGVRADDPQKLDQPKPDLLTRLGQLCLLRLVNQSGDVAAEHGARSLQQVVEGRVPPVDRKLDVRREDGLADDDEYTGPGEDYVEAGPGEEELAQHR